MPAVADKQVTLQLIQRPEHVNSGGHIDSLHSPTQRPLGKLLKKVGRTGTNGCFSTTYTPSHISGYVGINGQVMSLQGGVNLLTRVDGLFDLGDGENFNLTGNKPWHPQNHFGTGPANSGLRQIAEDYRAAYYGTGPMPESAKLMYNDTSLDFGGKFEIGKNWLNSGAHGEHRAGINNDTRYCGTDDGSVPAERHNNLMQIFINRGSTGTLDERRTKSPHWHLRFLFGAANAIGERTPHSFTEDVFGAALKRESNQSEYENWTARIADAKTQGEAELLAEVKALEREVFLSPEYLSSARAESGGGDEQLIDDVFWAHLFREATEEELDYWQAYLLSYSSVNMESHIATFLATFQNSSEFQSNVLAMVDPSGPSTP